jgi:putative addiction module killer protein
MVGIRQTVRFVKWLAGLRDLKARVKLQARIERLIGGNPGDVKAVGAGVSELRINYGPGYRVYYLQRGAALIILLAGGDHTQIRAIGPRFLHHSKGRGRQLTFFPYSARVSSLSGFPTKFFDKFRVCFWIQHLLLFCLFLLLKTHSLVH